MMTILQACRLAGLVWPQHPPRSITWFWTFWGNALIILKRLSKKKSPSCNNFSDLIMMKFTAKTSLGFHIITFVYLLSVSVEQPSGTQVPFTLD